MNKERARELVKAIKKLLEESDKHTLEKFNEEYIQALDIAIDSLERHILIEQMVDRERSKYDSSRD